jgi:primary-amine oxidase
MNIINFTKTLAEGAVAPRLGSVFYEEDGTQTLWGTFLGVPTSGFDSVSLL